MPADVSRERRVRRRAGPFWILPVLAASATCATSADRPPDNGARPACAQPFAEGKCLEGTWPATWRDGRWDCRIVQDQLALDGVPADRCSAFVSAEEVAERLRTMNSGRARGTLPGQ